MIINQIILFKFIQIHINADWYNVSDKYTLSENFIRKFRNKVYWYNIISKIIRKLYSRI